VPPDPSRFHRSHHEGIPEVKKSSSAIALVLVSAIVLPLGCSKENECKEKLPNGQPNPNCAGVRHGSHFGRGPFVHVPGGRSTGGSKSTGASPRGGFGGSGGGHASS